MNEPPGRTISADAIVEQLAKVLSSALFATADQSRALLKFIVQEYVENRTERLKEYTVGAEALGRGASFDPRTDTVVRAEASRLRSRLERYYAGEGKADPIEISLPKGSYIPRFEQRENCVPDSAEVASVPAPAAISIPQPIARRSGWGASWVAAGAFVALAAGVWALSRFPAHDDGNIGSRVLQFAVAPPTGSIFEAPIGRQSLAVSPDGTRLAFVLTDNAGSRVWVRDLASLELTPVAGTEGARTVFWALDSQSLFYSVRRQFRQANLKTGSSRSLGRLPFSAMYGSWRSKDELILYLGPRWFYELQTQSGGLRALPDTSMRWAEFLPGREDFVHVVFDPKLARYRAQVTEYATGRSVPLMETDSRVQYAPPAKPGAPGHLLFIRGGSLLAQPFDAHQRRLMGEAVPLVQNVTFFGPSASGNFSVSANGVLAYEAGFPMSELRWYDRSGQAIGTVGRPMPFNGTVRLSPDGSRLVAGVCSPENGGIDVWAFNEDGSESQRLTFPPAVHPRSVWALPGTAPGFRQHAERLAPSGDVGIAGASR